MRKSFAVIAIAGFIVATLAWLITKQPAASPQPAPSPSPSPTSYGGQMPISTRVFLPSNPSPQPSSIDTSSKTQCAEGERLVTIPTSSEFAVDETPFCSKLNIGPTFVSPDGKWTAAIESIPGTDLEGRLYYQLPYGPGLWEADHNLSILFANRLTGEQKEFGIARAVLQGDVISFAEGQERMESGIAAWSADGKQFWGWASFSTNADAGVGVGDFSAQPLWAAFFKIDMNTWKAESYLIPVPIDHLEVGVSQKLSDVLNADSNIALYGEIIASSTVSLNLYNFATHATTSVAFFRGDFKPSECDQNSVSAPFCQTETYRLEARWLNSSTVSWVDPQAGEPIIKSIF